MREPKKIMTVFGTRPEAIKLAPLILSLKEHPTLKCSVCVTAQHRQMLDQVLSIFDITPDIDLNIMRPNQNLAEITARAVEALYGVFLQYSPDLILVQGDTTTVFCATLAAFYRRLPVGHVEAGLRTGNMAMPWPEEATRILTSRLATLHFAPTQRARQNLLDEGISDVSIYVTGNTVIDALFHTLQRLEDLAADGFVELGEIADIPLESRVVLITGHRRESFGEGFEHICRAISELAETFQDVHFVYPVHLNPNVREPVQRILGNESRSNIHLIEPLSYPAFVYLMNRSYLMLSDSGGIQEEAPSLGKPVLVMRETTERPEAIMAGTAKLVGTDRERIVTEISRLLLCPEAYDAMSRTLNLYGDGKATERIIAACEKFLVTD